MIKRNVMFYYSLSRSSFLNLAVFRGNFFTALISDILLLVLSILLWQALYRTGIQTPEQSFSQVVTYLLLARLAIPVDMDFVNNLQQRVLRGDIVAELLKPMDISKYLLAIESGNYLTRLLFRGLPVIIIILSIYKVPIPSFPYLALFLLSLFFSFLLMFYINFITAIAAFWIIHLFSLNVLKSQIVRFFSGSFIPLWFFPIGLQNVLIYLPFASIVYVPVQIYLERDSLTTSFQMILLQIGWVIVMMLLSKLLWKQATKELVINGG